MKIRATKPKNNYKFNRLNLGSIFKLRTALLLFIGSLILIPAVASAVTLLSQGYSTDKDLSPGTIVSLRKDSNDFVEAATIDNANNIFGVVIDNSNSQLTLTSGKSKQVQVATTGVAIAFVSDINGKISAGDSITSSPISGIGMRATTNAKVVGVAQDNFPNSTASKQDYTDKNKQKHTVTLGQIPVLVSVSYFYKQPDKTLIPSAIQNIANALAGKPVKSLPILISIAIFFVTLIIVVSIIYAMIHSSIISVGRNPMAQTAIYRNVIMLSALVVVILGVAVVSIYMVLARF